MLSACTVSLPLKHTNGWGRNVNLQFLALHNIIHSVIVQPSIDGFKLMFLYLVSGTQDLPMLRRVHLTLTALLFHPTSIQASFLNSIWIRYLGDLLSPVPHSPQCHLSGKQDNDCIGQHSCYPITTKQRLLPSWLLICCHPALIYWKGHFGSHTIVKSWSVIKNILNQQDFKLCWLLKSLYCSVKFEI